MNGFKSLFLNAEPSDGDDANYEVTVVFTDSSADHAQRVFDEVRQQLAVPSYVEDGIAFGPFYEGITGTAAATATQPTGGWSRLRPTGVTMPASGPSLRFLRAALRDSVPVYSLTLMVGSQQPASDRIPGGQGEGPGLSTGATDGRGDEAS
jgi:hypothetical protein